MTPATRHDLQELRTELRAELASKADLQQLGAELRAELASKADLERFATKADLERFATKADLERFATKADVERYATKADLEGLESRLMAAFAQLASSLREYLGDLVRPFDDKYKHLPGEIAAVKQELAAHSSDKSIHHTHARTKRAPAKRRP